MQLVGRRRRARRAGGGRAAAQVDQITQNVQALVALGIDGGLFRAVVGADRVRIRIRGGFRRDLLFVGRVFPGKMTGCKFGLSTVSSVRR